MCTADAPWTPEIKAKKRIHPAAEVVKTEQGKPGFMVDHYECPHCLVRFQDERPERVYVCTADNPWRRDKAEIERIQCSAAKVVRNEQGKPGFVLDVYRCPHCGDEWPEERPDPAPPPESAPEPAKPLQCEPEERRELEYLMTVLADARAALGMPAAPDVYEINADNASMLLRRLRSLRREHRSDPVPLLSAVIVAKVFKQSQSGNPRHRAGDYATAPSFCKDKGEQWKKNLATGSEVLRLANDDDCVNALLAAARALAKGSAVAPVVAQAVRQLWGGPASLDDGRLSIPDDEIPY